MLVKVVFGLSLATFLPGMVIGIPFSRRGSESSMNKQPTQFHPRFNPRPQHHGMAGAPGKHLAHAGPGSRAQLEAAPERNPYELIKEARMGYQARGGSLHHQPEGGEGSYNDFVNRHAEAEEMDGNDNFGMVAQPSGIANEAMMQKAFGSPNFPGQPLRSMSPGSGSMNSRRMPMPRRSIHPNPMTGDPEDY